MAVFTHCFQGAQDHNTQAWLGLSSASVIQDGKGQNPSARLQCQLLPPPPHLRARTRARTHRALRHQVCKKAEETRGPCLCLCPGLFCSNIGFSRVTNCPGILGFGANMSAPWLHLRHCSKCLPALSIGLGLSCLQETLYVV